MKLENPRHEAFARGLAAGKSQAQSYADAGYSGCRQSASRLSAHADIQQRVQELREQPQSPIKIDGRDPDTGQFLVGHSGNGGRPRGSRNKLGEQFVADLYSEWQQSGTEALKAVAKNDPTAFVKITANLLPKELDQTLNINVDLFQECRDFAAAFRLARQVIGADDDDPLLIEAEAESDD